MVQSLLFFNDTAPTEIYTLSLHDALPIFVTPLTFLGGAFYSIEVLPEPWRTITLFNPVVYLISGFRWTFYGTADVAVGDRKSTRLNSSHANISYAVFCLKKKTD